MKKTGVAIGVSVALHVILAAVVFAAAPRTPAWPAEASAVAPLPVATRVSLFPRPVERSVARAEAPPRRLRVVKTAAALASSEIAAVTTEEAATAADRVPSTVVDEAGSEPSAAPTRAGAADVPAGPANAATRTLDIAALHAAFAASALRCYPAGARRFNLTGEVTVEFCLEPGGALRSVTLDGTTGQNILDAAARECVVKGAMPLPAEAFGGCYAMPVRFGR